MQSKIFSVNKTLNAAGRLIDLSQPRVMGILNVTPDSFYDGKRYNDDRAVLNQAEKMLGEGADFIDEELNRVVPAIKSIVKNFPEAVISIDTFRSQVAKEAVEAGAVMVNDISGGGLDEKMFSTVASLGVPYILMHMRGTPQTMTQQTDYDNLRREIIDYFHSKIFQLQSLGMKDIIIDQGFGFAKSVEQNFELLNNLNQFRILSKPMLVGLSRKSMIWKTLKTNPEEALNGTTALNVVALMKGASILRVHDVREAKEAILLTTKMSLN